MQRRTAMSKAVAMYMKVVEEVLDKMSYAELLDYRTELQRDIKEGGSTLLVGGKGVEDVKPATLRLVEDKIEKKNTLK
jgi:hypothetical protein